MNTRVRVPVEMHVFHISSTVLHVFVNTTIGFSESVCVFVCVCVCVCFCTITQKEIDLGTQNWNTL